MFAGSEVILMCILSQLRNVETMIQTRLSEPEEKVAAEERATLTKLQEELYSVEVSCDILDENGLRTEDD